jgi:hypothetical protein
MKRYLIILGLLLTSCAPKPDVNAAATQAIQTHADQATHTLIPPTATRPTSTPRATSTPRPPTPTFAPPSETLDFLTNPRVQWADDFSTAYAWDLWSGQEGVSDGTLQVPPSGGVTQRRLVGEGMAVLVSYQTDSMRDGGSGLRLESGKAMTDSFRQAGIVNGPQLKFNRTEGMHESGAIALPGGPDLLPNTWYVILLAMSKDTQLLVAAWDPQNPSRKAVYRVSLGPDYASLIWHFSIWTSENETVRMKEFALLTFEGFK